MNSKIELNAASISLMAYGLGNSPVLTLSKHSLAFYKNSGDSFCDPGINDYFLRHDGKRFFSLYVSIDGSSHYDCDPSIKMSVKNTLSYIDFVMSETSGSDNYTWIVIDNVPQIILVMDGENKKRVEDIEKKGFCINRVDLDPYQQDM